MASWFMIARATSISTVCGKSTMLALAISATRVFRSCLGEDLPGLGGDANLVPVRMKVTERSLGIDGLRGAPVRVRENTFEFDGLAHRAHRRDRWIP